MPGVAALAAQGWTFESATSAAPLTMPSIASLMTGLYPDRTGVISHDRQTRLDCVAPTLAELARRAGYATAAVVSNPWLASRGSRFDRGFNLYKTRRGEKLGPRRLDAATVTDLAIEALQAAPRPLLLWVHYIDTHMPYQPPLEDAAAVGNSSGSSAVIRDFVSETVDHQTLYFDAPYAPAELEDTRRLYDGASRYVDREISRLLRTVDDVLGRERTIVIVTADHGESLGEHGLYFAHDFTLYEELTHVPLVMRLPGERPARIDAPVSLVDVLPTLCARTPIRCPAEMDGKPLTAAGGQQGVVYSAGAPYRERYARNPFTKVRGLEGRWTAMRRGDLKVIRIPDVGGVRWELYDLGADPAETHNVFDPDRDRSSVASLESWTQAQRQSGSTPSRGAARRGKGTRAELRALGYLD